MKQKLAGYCKYGQKREERRVSALLLGAHRDGWSVAFILLFSTGDEPRASCMPGIECSAHPDRVALDSTASLCLMCPRENSSPGPGAGTRESLIVGPGARGPGRGSLLPTAQLRSGKMVHPCPPWGTVANGKMQDSEFVNLSKSLNQKYALQEATRTDL